MTRIGEGRDVRRLFAMLGVASMESEPQHNRPGSICRSETNAGEDGAVLITEATSPRTDLPPIMQGNEPHGSTPALADGNTTARIITILEAA